MSTELLTEDDLKRIEELVALAENDGNGWSCNMCGGLYFIERDPTPLCNNCAHNLIALEFPRAIATIRSLQAVVAEAGGVENVRRMINLVTKIVR